MTIWVDADACPAAIREIICRAAKRCSMTTYFVANHHIALPKLPNISMLQVGSGFDVADQMIAERSQAGDLVITSDIPLAAELIAKKVEVISSRGQIFNADNVRARLNMRDFMETMRSSGVHTGGPAALSAGDKQSFANALDRYLARAPKSL